MLLLAACTAVATARGVPHGLNPGRVAALALWRLAHAAQSFDCFFVVPIETADRYNQFTKMRNTEPFRVAHPLISDRLAEPRLEVDAARLSARHSYFDDFVETAGDG